MKLLRNTVLIQLALILFIPLSSLTAATTIAVMDFIPKGVTDIEASALTDRLRTELVQIGKYKVVEKEMMNVILAEQGFQMTGCVSDKCIVAAGQILGAAQMVAGSVSKVSRVHSVSARIVDVESGEILKVATYDHEGDLGELLKTGMEYIAKVLTDQIVEDTIIVEEEKPDTKLEERITRQPEPPTTQGSAISISYSLPYPGRGDGTNHAFFGNWMFSLEYSKGLSTRLILGLEFGYGKLEYREYKQGDSPYSDFKEVNGPQYTYLMRIYYLLNPGKRPGFSLFLGVGAMRAKEIDRWTYDAYSGPYISNANEAWVFLLLPVGVSAEFAHAGNTGFILDLGYLFSPKDPAHDININPYGFTAAIRAKFHL
ncbi:MAG: DUF2380 domain-containing protein [candidate division Zixibacteria bacterium]|nr:DUF2380 domain-containing protein [candidate division Zixibacteria bacterium]